ncbi:fluoride efflux transporter CrcB [Bacillus sp. UMB0728]|uniref:fluoride efflux transporter CrcB n=1 Tax=Bacillus sp. UMB0728 TaxID=2066052 RepID=UPI000C78DE71|nr:fluoride efflux transporter CrcB [Bacillus sp. UMB0728]PLR70299.1 fluoride efflux transporter CrcB [Bacillus sp. UMB0728]
MRLLLVIVGGFFGAICRYGLGEWVHVDNGLPLGTLLINLIGCLFLGWFLTFMSKKGKNSEQFTLIVGTGFIGSFTTFSTFSVETIQLLQEGFVVIALFYVLTSTIFGLIMVYLGYRMALFHVEVGDVE